MRATKNWKQWELKCESTRNSMDHDGSDNHDHFWSLDYYRVPSTLVNCGSYVGVVRSVDLYGDHTYEGLMTGIVA